MKDATERTEMMIFSSTITPGLNWSAPPSIGEELSLRYMGWEFLSTQQVFTLSDLHTRWWQDSIRCFRPVMCVCVWMKDRHIDSSSLAKGYSTLGVIRIAQVSYKQTGTSTIKQPSFKLQKFKHQMLGKPTIHPQIFIRPALTILSLIRVSAKSVPS